MKHWQLVLAIITAPIIASALDPPGVVLFAGYANIIAYTIYFLWLASIGMQLNLGRIKNFLYIVAVVSACLILIVTEVHRMFGLFHPETSLGPNSWASNSFFILWVIAVLITIQRLRKFEAASNLKGGTFLGDLVLLVIFPVGVWIIQPRLNFCVNVNPKME